MNQRHFLFLWCEIQLNERSINVLLKQFLQAHQIQEMCYDEEEKKRTVRTILKRRIQAVVMMQTTMNHLQILQQPTLLCSRC